MIAITQIQFDEDLRQSGIGRVFRAMDERCYECGGKLERIGRYAGSEYEQYTCDRCHLSELRMVGAI